MRKYELLAAALRDQAGDMVEMTFGEVAQLVHGLPASAYAHRAWWANSTAGNNAHSPGWLSAGWRVDHVDLQGQHVRFTRLPPDAVPPPSPTTPSIAGRTAAGFEPTGQSTTVAVDFTWLRGGYVSLDETGKPTFPILPTNPGIYRMMAEVERVAVEAYIGETDNLRRRMSQNYRNPGASQQTSLRINAWLRRHLTDGALVRLDIASEATVTIDADKRPLDLHMKPARLLVENAALVDTALAGVLAIVNR